MLLFSVGSQRANDAVASYHTRKRALIYGQPLYLYLPSKDD